MRNQDYRPPSRWPAQRWALLVLPIALAFLLDTEAAGQPQPPAQIDSRLVRVSERLSADGPEAALEAAEANGIPLEGGELRVIVEVAPGRSAEARGAVDRFGAVERAHGELLQVTIPPAALYGLQHSPGILAIRPPMTAYPLVTGQGVALTNADDWHTGGLTGAGVKVGVLDVGFQGYDALLGTELPPSVTVMSFIEGGDIYGDTPHGAGVAEIVHEMAPDAELYFANFSTEVEVAAAAEWLTQQGVDVINASWGYPTSGPGDGTGVIDEIVGDSVAEGVFWSVAGGNHADKHWSGTFTDTDNNGFHEFSLSPFDEGNQPSSLFGLLLAGETVAGELRWNDPWGASCRDYDLFLKRTDDSTVLTVASSENVQNDGVSCTPGADPVEVLVHQVAVTDEYHLVIEEKHSDSDAFLDLFSGYHSLEYQVAAGSMLQPGDSPDVTSVGAVPYSAPSTIEPFSSRGPTADGRIKPDIVGPDGVSNATFGAFAGTSAAAPHIGGAAALVLQSLPCLEKSEVGPLLETHVVDLGSAGKDNTFGSGRLSLGATPPDGDADAVADQCDNCPSTPNPGQENQDGDAWADACDNCPTVATPWLVPTGDDDCDGWPTATELILGTDPSLACGFAPGGDPWSETWPPDLFESNTINTTDVLALRPVFQTSVPPTSPRFDLFPDGTINTTDVLAIKPYFTASCTP
ncbi:MAG TPA: S8 family serine peptidase [Dehalococcoidia bacterium]|nr:S8 family serine peptidase [Dehalococcoidia bacterium]